MIKIILLDTSMSVLCARYLVIVNSVVCERRPCIIMYACLWTHLKDEGEPMFYGFETDGNNIMNNSILVRS